jgi:hypothetical protein
MKFNTIGLGSWRPTYEQRRFLSGQLWINFGPFPNPPAIAGYARESWGGYVESPTPRVRRAVKRSKRRLRLLPMQPNKRRLFQHAGRPRRRPGRSCRGIRRAAADCVEQNVPQLAGLSRAAIGRTASRKTCATKPSMTSSKWRPRWCLASLRSSAFSCSACSKAVCRKNLRSNSVGPSALRVASGNSLADRTVADDAWHMISETPCSGSPRISCHLAESGHQSAQEK